MGATYVIAWVAVCLSCRYFTEIKTKRDTNLLVLDTDACIFEDDIFRCGQTCNPPRMHALQHGAVMYIMLCITAGMQLLDQALGHTQC